MKSLSKSIGYGSVEVALGIIEDVWPDYPMPDRSRVDMKHLAPEVMVEVGLGSVVAAIAAHGEAVTPRPVDPK